MEDKLDENIYLDDTAKKLILFAFKQYKIIAILWIAVSMVSTGISLLSISVYTGRPTSSWIEVFNYKLMPFMYLAIVAANAVLLFNYYKAMHTQKKAVTEFDQALFVKSFLFYKNGNYASICALLLNLVNDGFILYMDYQYYSG